eukprot:3941963-Rhodomonas_salina.1
MALCCAMRARLSCYALICTELGHWYQPSTTAASTWTQTRPRSDSLSPGEIKRVLPTCLVHPVRSSRLIRVPCALRVKRDEKPLGEKAAVFGAQRREKVTFGGEGAQGLPADWRCRLCLHEVGHGPFLIGPVNWVRVSRVWGLLLRA